MSVNQKQVEVTTVDSCASKQSNSNLSHGDTSCGEDNQDRGDWMESSSNRDGASNRDLSGVDVTRDVDSMGHIIDPPEKPFSSGEGLTILSYLLAGLLFYGGLGWLAGYLLQANWLMPVGVIVGFVFSMYIVVKRHGE